MIPTLLDIVDIAGSESLALICLEALKLIGAWRENCQFSFFLLYLRGQADGPWLLLKMIGEDLKYLHV